MNPGTLECYLHQCGTAPFFTHRTPGRENEADDQRFIDLLQSNSVDALVLDDTWVRYNAAEQCSLYAVGQRRETHSVVSVGGRLRGGRIKRARCNTSLFAEVAYPERQTA